jgi:hypothetical protein
MAKHISARNVIQGVSFDLNRMLNDGTTTTAMYESIMRRLDRLREPGKWVKVDW